MKKLIISSIIILLLILIAYCSLVDLETANRAYVNPIIKLTNGLINSSNWPLVQKSGHYFTWLLLGALSLTAFTKRARLIYTLLFIFVVVIELCQFKVLGRFPLFTDVLISWAGLVTAFFVHKYCSNKKFCKKIMDGLKL